MWREGGHASTWCDCVPVGSLSAVVLCGLMTVSPWAQVLVFAAFTEPLVLSGSLHCVV